MTPTHPFITLTTDFGTQDPFVGVMKAQILERCGTAQIIDLSHAIPPFAPVSAGFWWRLCHPFFPAGTLHIGVVDPGVGTQRALLLGEGADQFFLGPDNGLFAPLIGAVAQLSLRRVSPTIIQQLAREPVSPTFHGRDVMAPLAAALLTGQLDSRAIGPRVHEVEPGSWQEPRRDGNTLHGQVVLADHFGNLFTNIERDVLAAGGLWELEVRDSALPLVRTYGDLDAGALGALVNSHGVIEIAQRQGSAADYLGVGPGEPVTLRHVQS
jgi:S-adenosylmethionine hydrolase